MSNKMKWNNIPMRERPALWAYRFMSHHSQWLRHIPGSRKVYYRLKRRVMADMARAIHKVVTSREH